MGASTTGGGYAAAVVLSGSGGSGPVAVGFNARLQIQGVVSVTMSGTAVNGDYLETTCKPQVASAGSGFSDAGPSSYVRVIEGADQAGNADGTLSVVGGLVATAGTYDARIVCASSGGAIANGATSLVIAGDAISVTAVAR
ncbi:MAG: hypothetical protein ACXVGQ_13120 [Mycobacteriaceae bacterium]